MSVDNLSVGTQFTSSNLSLGQTLSPSGADPVTYGETTAGTLLGPGAIATITNVVTAGGVTTVSATISGSSIGAANGQTLTGTVIGNGTNDILLNGTVPIFGPSDVLLTTAPAQQPGVGNTLNVPAEATAPAFVCYCPGTLIRTSRGDVEVEALRVGDKAVTASGSLRPIVWTGHRVVDCAMLASPSEAWPVRVRAGAFGGGLPERDLFLSPGHPVLVGRGPEETLVPIMCLINGTSIARVAVDEVAYWHVELDQHDIILAEGLPTESFLDFGNRSWFEDGVDHALTNPDFIPPGLGARCRPVAVDGPLVEAERRRLDRQFYIDLSAQCVWPAGADSSLGF